jgi:septal ring factor EnvC (AmiA/AmiB activator)
MAATFRPRPLPALIAWAMAACALLPALASAQDKSAERAARRAQMQLQGLQQQLQDAQAAQAKSDADKAEAEKKLSAQAQEIPRAQASARQAAAALKASEAARAELQAKLDALEKQSAEQKRSADAALAAKTAEFKATLDYRDAQQRQLQARFDNEVGQVFACDDKNRKLVELGAELLDRYRNKGFAEVTRQKDPVLGLGQVEMFNLVQDYRDRTAAQKVTPVPIGQPPQP